MARPKKADEQKQLAPAMQPQLPQAHAGPVAVPGAAVPPPVMNHANRSIDVPNFIRVRDSVSTDPSPPFPSTTTHPAHKPPPRILKQGSIFDGDNAIHAHHHQGSIDQPWSTHVCSRSHSHSHHINAHPSQAHPSMSLIIMSPSGSRLYYSRPQPPSPILTLLLSIIHVTSLQRSVNKHENVPI